MRIVRTNASFRNGVGNACDASLKVIPSAKSTFGHDVGGLKRFGNYAGLVGALFRQLCAFDASHGSYSSARVRFSSCSLDLLNST